MSSLRPEDARHEPRLLRAAERVGARLCRDAVWAGDRCAWVAPVEEPAPDGTWLAPHRATGPDLHSGTAGIALFLAHLHAVTGEPVFGMTARGAAAHAASRMEDVRPELRVGLHGGWAGIAWALDEVARATGGDGPAQSARAALERLATTAREAEPPSLDVMSGGAGAIAPLLRLAGEDDGSPLVSLAVEEGERLLAAATRGPAGWSWRTLGSAADPHLCGVSHGASGIAVALLELGVAVGAQRFVDAGRRGFAFESSHFSADAGGWPDLRVWPGVDPAAGGTVSATWCHGSAGGALARLRADALDPAPRLRAEAAAALETCRAVAGGDDGTADATLCHGSAGVGEALLAAGHREEATLLALRHVEAQDRGHVMRSGLLSGAETPSLMLGAAGWGLHLLRLLDAERVPGVLQIPGTARRAASSAAA